MKILFDVPENIDTKLIMFQGNDSSMTLEYSIRRWSVLKCVIVVTFVRRDEII